MSNGAWQVYVDGLEFYAYHGVSGAENEVGHRYRMRIECEFEGPVEPGRDDIRQTINYSDLSILAVEFCTNRRFKTIEGLVWGFANEAFKKFELIDSLSVTLEKAMPPMPVIAEAAGITLTIHRDDLSSGRSTR